MEAVWICPEFHAQKWFRHLGCVYMESWGLQGRNSLQNALPIHSWEPITQICSLPILSLFHFFKENWRPLIWHSFWDYIIYDEIIRSEIFLMDQKWCREDFGTVTSSHKIAHSQTMMCRGWMIPQRHQLLFSFPGQQLLSEHLRVLSHLVNSKPPAFAICF